MKTKHLILLGVSVIILSFLTFFIINKSNKKEEEQRIENLLSQEPSALMSSYLSSTSLDSNLLKIKATEYAWDIFCVYVFEGIHQSRNMSEKEKTAFIVLQKSLKSDFSILQKSSELNFSEYLYKAMSEHFNFLGLGHVANIYSEMNYEEIKNEWIKLAINNNELFLLSRLDLEKAKKLWNNSKFMDKVNVYHFIRDNKDTKFVESIIDTAQMPFLVYYDLVEFLPVNKRKTILRDIKSKILDRLSLDKAYDFLVRIDCSKKEIRELILLPRIAEIKDLENPWYYYHNGYLTENEIIRELEKRKTLKNPQTILSLNALGVLTHEETIKRLKDQKITVKTIIKILNEESYNDFTVSCLISFVESLDDFSKVYDFLKEKNNEKGIAMLNFIKKSN